MSPSNSTNLFVKILVLFCELIWAKSDDDTFRGPYEFLRDTVMFARKISIAWSGGGKLSSRLSYYEA